MSQRLLRSTAPIALVLGLILALPSSAGPTRNASVGSEGHLYVVREGTYGTLFPEQGLADPDAPALAVEVTRPDGTSERFLVPGTETDDVEDSASILFEEQSGTLFVLWQTKKNVIHSRLNLVGLRDGAWTETVEISGRPFGWKSSPQLAVTRDIFNTVEPDGGLRTWQRTVVHLLWGENGGNGEPLAFYSPIVLLDGVYTGWNPVYLLDELLPEDSDSAIPGVLNLPLAEAPKIETGRNVQSVTVGFVSPSTGDLVSIDLELTPGEISFIGDAIRAQIDDFGRELLPDQPGALAAKMRSEISDLGTALGFHPGLTRYLADQTYGKIVALDPEEPVGHLAERIRAQIDDFGARMTDRGFDRRATQDSILVLDLPSGEAGSASPGSQVRALVTAVREVPETGSRDVTLHLSLDGREALVSWLEDGVVYYRESRGDGWSAARPLRLGAELDLARAHEILEQRADERAGE